MAFTLILKSDLSSIRLFKSYFTDWSIRIFRNLRKKVSLKILHNSIQPVPI